MNKKVMIALLTLMCIIGAVSQTLANEPEDVSFSTPFRICFWPGVWSWPNGVDVYGMDLGFPASFSANKKNIIAGLDLAIFFSQTNTKGLQLSILNMSDGTDGLQIGAVNMECSNIIGAQISVFNEYKSSRGFQLGLINKAENSKGIQLGLINIMDNGFLPISPLINWGF
ncbi:MAG TPA: hypothetical protein QF753_10375 [Victivallales bacterium]|nr:hypothetical protein [Victivallales bacterium]